MKCVKFAAAIALCLGVGQAFAQTCAAPLALTSAGVTGVNGCAAGTTNTVGLVCGFTDNASQDTIFSLTIGAGFTATQITLTTTTATYTPQLILQGACGSTTECQATATGPAGGPATLAFAGADPAVGPGTLYLIVNGQGGAADCGTFSLAVNGTLPVQLQKFSVD